MSPFFNPKLSRLFQHKPNQIPPLGNSISSDLQAVGFKKKTIAQSITTATPPWLMSRPVVHFRLHCLDKDITSWSFQKPFLFCHSYSNYYRIYTDSSKTGDGAGAAVVHRNKTKCFWLLNTASIFRAELYALTARHTLFAAQRRNFFVIFSDSISCLQSISGFKIELDFIQRFIKDYSTFSKRGKTIVLCWIPSQVGYFW